MRTLLIVLFVWLTVSVVLGIATGLCLRRLDRAGRPRVARASRTDAAPTRARRRGERQENLTSSSRARE